MLLNGAYMLLWFMFSSSIAVKAEQIGDHVYIFTLQLQYYGLFKEILSLLFWFEPLSSERDTAALSRKLNEYKHVWSNRAECGYSGCLSHVSRSALLSAYVMGTWKSLFG